MNSKARNAQHGCGGEARWDRNTKATKQNASPRGSMRSNLRHGLDYTPLFRFLLSKVGTRWDEVHSEAIKRLDKPDPIFWLVAIREENKRAKVRVGESSFYSGLYVDDAGQLAIVDPGLRAEDLAPSCACCTHTFNGERFGKPFVP